MISTLRRIFKAKSTRFLLSGALLTGALSMYGADPAAITVSWDTLLTLNVETPKAAQSTAAAVKLDNKRISIAGFMVPLDDDAMQVNEFLLVSFAGACIHVPPPPPNQMIYVKVGAAQKTVKVPYTDPITVVGPLKVETVDSPYGDISYTMVSDSVTRFKQ